MSVAADQKVIELSRRVEQLEKLVADMVTVSAQGKSNGNIPPEPDDKRTSDWKRWNERYGHYAGP